MLARSASAARGRGVSDPRAPAGKADSSPWFTPSWKGSGARVKDAEAVSLVLELARTLRWSLIGRDGAELPKFTRLRAGKLLRRGKERRLALIMGAVLEMPAS